MDVIGGGHHDWPISKGGGVFFYLENKLLLISINFTLKNQPHLPKNMVHYVLQVNVCVFFSMFLLFFPASVGLC